MAKKDKSALHVHEGIPQPPQVNKDAVERYGIAWQAAKPSEGEQTWWYDLNSDGKVNEIDIEEITMLVDAVNSSSDPELALTTVDLYKYDIVLVV